eukprot:s186_g1.t2
MVLPARLPVLLQNVRKDAVQPTLFSYSSAISSKGRNDWEAALCVLNMLPAAGLLPGCVSYGIVMRTIAHTCRLWELGISMLRKMQVQMVQGNEITASTAVTTSGRSSAWQPALELFSRMLLHQLCQDVISYTAAIASCEPVGRWQKMLEINCWAWRRDQSLLMEMPLLDVVACGAAVSACAKAGAWQEALGLLFTMSTQTLQPNTICVNAAISACERSGCWEVALQLLYGMPLQALQRDDVSCCAATSACVRAVQWQVALSLLVAFSSMLLQRTAISFNAAMSACEKAKRWQTVLQLVRDMGSQSLLLDSVTTGVVGLACDNAEQWQRSLQFQWVSSGCGISAGLPNLAQRLVWSEGDRAELGALLDPKKMKLASPQNLVLLVWCAASLAQSKRIFSDVGTQLVNYLSSGQLTWRENARLAWSLANLEVHDGNLLQTLQEDRLQEKRAMHPCLHTAGSNVAQTFGLHTV